MLGRTLASALLTGAVLILSVSPASGTSGPKGPDCGTVRVRGDNGIVQMKVIRLDAELRCKTARSVIRTAWRLPKPKSGVVRPPHGWECRIRGRNTGGVCGPAGTAVETIYVFRVDPPPEDTTYVPVG